MAERQDTAPQDQQQVEYRDVPGFPGYRVGSDGSVWGCRMGGSGFGKTRAWRPVKGRKERGGYLIVNLFQNGKPHRKKIHRLILEVFVGPCPDGMEACHNDGSRTNNAVSNLRWDTRAANHADKNTHGTMLRGTKHPGCKLTAEQVVEIRRRYAAGEYQWSIASSFGVSQTNVGLIVRRKTWSHI